MAAVKQGEQIGIPLAGWAVLGAVGWMLVYADRAVFGPLLVAIGHHFAVGPAELGLLGSAFFFAYTALQVPAGMVADHLSPRALLAGSFVGFGAAIALGGVVGSFVGLTMLLLLAGAAQAIYFPAQYAVTARGAQGQARDLTTAITNGGMGVGVAIGFGVAAWPQAGAHWQALLVVAGLLTMMASVLFWRAAPARVPVAAHPRSRRIPWSRDLWLLCLVNFGSLFGFFFMLTWLPYYLQTVSHLQGGALALTSALSPLIAAPAGVLWVRLVKDRRLLAIRLFLPLAGLSLLAVPLIGAPGLLLVPLIAYGLVGKLSTDPLILGEATRRLPVAGLGAGLGVLNFSGMLASVVAPAVAGLMAQGGHLAWAFDLAALLLGLGLVASLGLRPVKGQGADLVEVN
ncbi:MAG: MFS transporter [Sulfobacillus sp.]